MVTYLLPPKVSVQFKGGFDMQKWLVSDEAIEKLLFMT
jgi:hypothetical protein